MLPVSIIYTSHMCDKDPIVVINIQCLLPNCQYEIGSLQHPQYTDNITDWLMTPIKVIITVITIIHSLYHTFIVLDWMSVRLQPLQLKYLKK